jgi:hypothetical protein
VGPRAGLEAKTRGNSPLPLSGHNIRTVFAKYSHCTCSSLLYIMTDWTERPEFVSHSFLNLFAHSKSDRKSIECVRENRISSNLVILLSYFSF